MKCEECDYRFKCLTTEKLPHKVIRLNTQSGGYCHTCKYSPWYVWRTIVYCKKAQLMTYGGGVCDKYDPRDYKKSAMARLKNEMEKVMKRKYRGRLVYCTREDDSDRN